MSSPDGRSFLSLQQKGTKKCGPANCPPACPSHPPWPDSSPRAITIAEAIVERNFLFFIVPLPGYSVTPLFVVPITHNA